MKRLFNNEAFKKALPWIILIAGGVLYFMGYLGLEKDEPRPNMFFKIADALLIGVILTLLSTIAQSFGIFKDDLKNILYGQDFLSKGRKSEEVWENVSRQMFQKKFPEISQALLSIIQKQYLPVNAVNYYQNYTLDIELKWEDIKREIMTTREILSFEILTENTKEFTISPGGNIDIEGLKRDDYYFRVIKCIINNQVYKGKESSKPIESNKKIEHKYEIKLSGRTKYKVILVKEKKYSFSKDFDISFKAQYLINNLDVTLRFPKNLEINFINRGTISTFEDGTNGEGIIQKKYNGLVLPQQGYVFVMKKKQKNGKLQ